jgi:Flp pilus assembly protein CpaB
VRASRAFLLIAVVAGIGGFLFLWKTRTPLEVYVAAWDIPAYHQIVERDVRRTRVNANEIPAETVRDRDLLLGRYTLAPLAQDKPYTRAALGPVLTSGALEGLGLVAFEASAETTLGGNLARGDRVDVLLSATDAALASGSAVLSGVLVLDIRVTEKNDRALVLALTAGDQKSLLAGVGTSRIVVVRTSPYVRA